jgi:cell division protein FtsQ
MAKEDLKEARSEKPFLRSAIRYMGLLLFICVCYQIAMKFIEPRMLPIKHVKVSARAKRVDLGSLKKRMQPYVRGFFSTKTVILKREMMREPFVDEIVIKRSWPDTLLVYVKEIVIIANWRNEKAVNSKGELVDIKLDQKNKLPLFEGPENQVAKLLVAYKGFSEVLRPLNLFVSELRLNLRHSWQITLDNDITLYLGRKDLFEHMKTFVAVYPKLKRMHGDRLEAVDLRHTNGVSVRLSDSQ